MATEQQLRDYLRRATLELAECRREVEHGRQQLARTTEPIAIVGMACRFPGNVEDPDGLWDLVHRRVDATGNFPTDRGWDLETLFDDDPDASGRSYVRRGGFLHDAADFDAAFFELSPRAATAADPQHRLLLELTWEVLERAGLDPNAQRGSATGVWVGSMFDHYSTRFLGAVPESVEGSLLTGGLPSVLSGRLAYHFGFEGPTISVDTACSTSLVALHLAVQSLRRGECDRAVTGGVTVMATPDTFVEFSRQRGLAPDGRCKPFAAGADGVAWSEGAGMLLLERLSDAQRLGHEVLAVVTGSAINQDGRSNGLTAPHGPAQERVIRAALRDAGIGPGDVDVVEAHGTGTPLGDPIEARALLNTYGRDRSASPLLLGSVKSNIGHTQAAAGIASVIKTVAGLRRGLVGASLHAEKTSPHLDLETAGVRVAQQEQAWPASDHPARAGVSGFGISGSNAHVVIEAAPALDRPTPAVGITDLVADGMVWVLSARTSESLRRQASRLIGIATDASDPVDVGRALAGRAVMAHRAVLLAADRAELLAALTALAAGDVHPALVTGLAEAVTEQVFVFPGQGSQWAGMTVDLLDRSGLFARALTECDAALRPHTGWSVLDVLRRSPGAPELSGSDVVQPVLFAVMTATAALWQACGVTPDTVLGHSQGEIAAAVVAGALDLSAGARVVALRSRALLALRGTGGMAGIALPPAEAAETLLPWTDRLWVAVCNGPDRTVVAGDVVALQQWTAAVGSRAEIRRIDVDYASHTPQVEPVRARILADLADIAPRSVDAVRFLSSSRGAVLDPAELTGGYWYDSLRSPVRFDRAVGTLTGRPLLIEVGPHPVLSGDIVDQLAHREIAGRVCHTLRRGARGPERFRRALAEAFVAGARVDWRAVLGGSVHPHPELPTYAFDRRRHWLDEPTRAALVPGIEATGHPLVPGLVRPASGGLLFTGQLSAGRDVWIADHRLDGDCLLPGAAVLELVLTAAVAHGATAVHELTWERRIPVPPGTVVPIQVAVGVPDATGTAEIGVYIRADGRWNRCATGIIGRGAPQTAAPAGGATGEVLDPAAEYERLALGGFGYGPAFVAVTALSRDGDEAVAEVTAPTTVRAEADRYVLHPALLDAALHAGALSGLQTGVPFNVRGVTWNGRGATDLRVRLRAEGPELGVRIEDTDGRTVLGIEALRVRVREIADLPPLHVVEQVPVPVRAAATPRLLGVLTELRPEELHAAAAGAADVLVRCPGADLEPSEIRATLTRVLVALQIWLGAPVAGGGRLIVAVVRPHDDDTVSDAVLGLLRSAHSERPEALVIADVPAGFSDWPLLCGTTEPELTVVGGAVHAPRLVRRPSVAERDLDLADGTVLVTGGTGGLGTLLAEHLARRHGVRHLLLLSRRGAAAAGTAELRERLSAHGATSQIVAVDVTDREALRAVLAAIPVDRPLTGVVHAAGIAGNATFPGLTGAILDAVLAPKIDAAEHLHALTRGLPLRTFVLFSSLAGLLGNAGQGAYAAANAHLDGLARRRATLGLPGVSIQWGLWELRTEMTVGVDRSRFTRTGVSPLRVDRGLALFDAALQSGPPVVAAADWAQYPDGGIPPLLSGILRARPPETTDRRPLQERLESVEPAVAAALLLELVRLQVASVLGHADPSGVDVDSTFGLLGFDSLTTVELRNRVGRESGVRLSATVAFDHPSTRALAAHLQTLLLPPPPSPEDKLLAVLDTMRSIVPVDQGADRDRFLQLVRNGVDAIVSERPGDEADLITASDDEIFAYIDARL